MKGDSRGDAVLVLFARVPERGRGKTRLAGSIGEEAAHDLHRALLIDTIEIVHRASTHGYRRAIWFSEPWEPDAEIAAHLGGFSRDVQSGGDLGERMQSCLAELLSTGGARRVVILGSDHPTLPVEFIVKAFEALRDRDIVLGPSADGGYYLLGARTVAPEMFRGIMWGGPRVLSDTVAILRMLGMAPVKLPEWYDIDRPEDLTRLREEIGEARRQGRPWPRRTAAVLDRLDGAAFPRDPAGAATRPVRRPARKP